MTVSRLKGTMAMGEWEHQHRPVVYMYTVVAGDGAERTIE